MEEASFSTRMSSPRRPPRGVSRAGGYGRTGLPPPLHQPPARARPSRVVPDRQRSGSSTSNKCIQSAGSAQAFFRGGGSQLPVIASLCTGIQEAPGPICLRTASANSERTVLLRVNQHKIAGNSSAARFADLLVKHHGATFRRQPCILRYFIPRHPRLLPDRHAGKADS